MLDALKDGLLSGLITEGHARALAAIDDQNLMVEAYKIILRESGSVRRAEELARRMKAKSGQKAKVGTRKDQLRIVSEELDKMQEKMQKAFSDKKDEETNNTSKVKLIRSRRETKITFTFKGSLEDTEKRLQKVFKAVTK
jgi:ParB-like chromosome segregation protein Spo0J